jgi:hypothetical protein
MASGIEELVGLAQVLMKAPEKKFPESQRWSTGFLLA